MSKIETIQYTATKDGFAKADLAVKSFFDLPRAQIRALFQHDCVTINGRLCTNPGTPLRPGDKLEIRYEPDRRYKERQKKPDTRGYQVVYEDGHLIVVDKDAGMLTVPTNMEEPGTLIDNIRRYLPFGMDLQLVHRLDRDTSGLLVFAKSKGIARKIKEQFERRKPERVYDAFVRGKVLEEKGTFESYLATDENLNQYSVQDPTEGKLAITHYTVEKHINDATWVKVRLETGRRNQIRVHFSEKNHPVIGDSRYRVKLAKHPNWKNDFLALHASTLGFYHPASDKKLSFESPLPRRMKAFLAQNL